MTRRYRTGLRQLEAADAIISDMRVELVEQRMRIEVQKAAQLSRTHADVLAWTRR